MMAPSLTVGFSLQELATEKTQEEKSAGLRERQWGSGGNQDCCVCVQLLGGAGGSGEGGLREQGAFTVPPWRLLRTKLGSGRVLVQPLPPSASPPAPPSGRACPQRSALWPCASKHGALPSGQAAGGHGCLPPTPTPAHRSCYFLVGGHGPRLLPALLCPPPDGVAGPPGERDLVGQTPTRRHEEEGKLNKACQWGCR